MKRLLAFTLLEVLLALVLLSLLSGIGLHGVSQLLRSVHNRQLLQAVLSALHIAKYASETYHAPIVVCHLNNQSQCDGFDGEKLVVAFNQDKSGSVSNESAVLLVKQIQLYGGKLAYSFYPQSHHFILFSHDGQSIADNGAIWFCPANTSKPVWAIKVNVFGYARTLWPDKDGNIKNSHGCRYRCA